MCDHISFVNGHGMIIIDNTLCEVFESMEIMALRAQADVVLVYLVYAGGSRGATLEHLAKIWRIPLDDDAETSSLHLTVE